MANNYYTFTPEFVPAQKVRSDEVNLQYSNIETAFDALPTDIDAIVNGTTYVGTESGSGNSYIVTLADPRTALAEGDHISFLATHTNTGASQLNLDGLGLISIVHGNGDAMAAGDLTAGLYYEAVYTVSGNRWQLTTSNNSGSTAAAASAAAAAASAAAALVSENAAAADLLLTNADVVSTNADVVLTNADAAATAQDAIDTAADAAATAADLVQTNLDTIDTGADVISSGTNASNAQTFANVALGYAVDTQNDAAATAADLVQTNLDQISCAADAVLTAADVTYADEWATKAEDSLISVAAGGDGSTDYSALHWAAKAAASAATNNLPSSYC